MRVAPRAVVLLLCAVLGGACVTPLTREDVEEQLERVAVQRLGERNRVIPIYAETDLVARALLTEAKLDPESPLSVRVGRRLAIAARRRLHAVVGGPHAELSERVTRNALQLNRDQGLRGLRVVYVSTAPPSEALLREAHAIHARVEHLPFQAQR